LSILGIRAERRQKSISVEFSFATVFAFKHHVSVAYTIVLVIVIVLYDSHNKPKPFTDTFNRLDNRVWNCSQWGWNTILTNSL